MSIPRSGAIGGTHTAFAPRILVFGALALEDQLDRWDFENQGFRIEVSRTEEHAVRTVERARPDLALIDTRAIGNALPELCARLRSATRTQTLPIILWPNRLDELVPASASLAGVEDSIAETEPPTEVVALLKAVLRRARPVALVGELCWGELRLDEAAHRVFAGEEEISLKSVEYRLLAIFMDQPSTVLSRDDLVRRLWGRRKPVDVRTIDMCVNRLRRALGRHGQSDLVFSVRGVGYRFTKPG